MALALQYVPFFSSTSRNPSGYWWKADDTPHSSCQRPLHDRLECLCSNCWRRMNHPRSASMTISVQPSGLFVLEPRLPCLVILMPELGPTTTYGTESLVNTVFATSTAVICVCWICVLSLISSLPTLFQQRNQCRTTWMHPKSKHWHLLDYVIVCRSDRHDVHLTRGMHGAECWTDHCLVCAYIQPNIRPPIHEQQPKKWLNVRACRDPSKVDLLCENVYPKLQSHLDPDLLAQRDWETLRWMDKDRVSNCIMDAATASFGFSTKKASRLVQRQWYLHSAVALGEKMLLMLPNSITHYPLHYIRSGLSFVHAHRKNFIKWKTSGGPTKPRKSNPMQISMIRRNFMMQSEQYMATGITPCILLELKMELPWSRINQDPVTLG